MKGLRNLGKNISKLISENQLILYIFIFLLAFSVYLWVQSSPTFLDPDSFYHLKMTKLISQRGPILDFPWLQFTVLKNYYIDHHFLYHVLAIPFVSLLGDFAGFKFYTIILATSFIFLSYVLLKKAKLKYAEIFVLALLFSPSLMFRVSLAKASAISLLILFLGIYCIFWRKYWPLAVISFFYVWTYGGFLLLLAMAFLYILANAFYLAVINPPLWLKLKRFGRLAKIKDYLVLFLKQIFSKEHLKIVGTVFCGLASGVVLNFYFPKNLYFYWQQLVQIGIINYRSQVNVGGEWYPFPLANLLSDTGAVMIIGVVAIVLFVLCIKKQKPESIFFFLAAILFFAMTLKSKRYVEYFVPVFTFFSAYTYTYILDNTSISQFFDDIKKTNCTLGWISNKIFIVFILFFALIIKDAHLTKQTFLGGIALDNFQGISQYLKANSQPGDIIMQTDWDDWPMLFYYNDKNYYIVGLDPTFMYKYDKNLYNLFTDITTTKISTDLYNQVKNNFHASYFIVDTDRPQLAKNLEKDGNFVKVYEDKEGKVYKLR